MCAKIFSLVLVEMKTDTTKKVSVAGAEWDLPADVFCGLNCVVNYVSF